MWPGDRRLCVLHGEPFVVLPGHAHWRQLTRAPPTAVPMPEQTSLVRGSEMPGPREGWPVLPDPFRHQGHLSSPDCPGGLDKGVCGLKGPSGLVWEPPREKVGPKASLKRGGAVIWWQETKNSCFGRRRLWGWRHHSPPGCLRPLGVATLARHTPRPRAAPLLSPSLSGEGPSLGSLQK